jgi:hypothetical protein
MVGEIVAIARRFLEFDVNGTRATRDVLRGTLILARRGEFGERKQVIENEREET